VFKNVTGLGRKPDRVRVRIYSATSAMVFMKLSRDATTWDECFAGCYPGRSIDRVLVLKASGEVDAPLQSPDLLKEDDSLLIEFHPFDIPLAAHG
jgi:hypothetical protein